MKITKNILMAFLALFCSAAFFSQTVFSAETPRQILFKNVQIFNGTSDKLITGKDVLVEGNLIKSVGSGLAVAANVEVIDGGGRTLMPGLIENHAHLMLMGPSLPAMEGMTTWEDFAIHGTKMSEMYLMQGFTTLRDAGNQRRHYYMPPALPFGRFPRWTRWPCGFR